jgi:sugar lactone lactonase YvrE
MKAHSFDSRTCILGEGALWHPLRQQLFWFDILKKNLFSRIGHKVLSWSFDDTVSAAGWVSQETLLIASARALFLFNMEKATIELIVDLEKDNPITRSNDGRADPFGGFWIGTMGLDAEIGAGAIYRFYRGELRKVHDNITISNAICFSPDNHYAYFCDTWQRQILRQRLDDKGWPSERAEVFIDLNKQGLNPDGAVVDALGNLWSAQWNASRVACYNSSGQFLHAIKFPAKQITCPAFGGPQLSTLYATSAQIGITNPKSYDGQVYQVDTQTRGQAEHQVIL